VDQPPEPDGPRPSPDFRSPAGSAAGTPVGRRVVLGMLGLGAVGVVAGGPVTGAFSRLVGALARHDPTGLSSLLPTGGWRIYTVTGGLPYESPGEYRLTVDGLVDRPLVLRLADLRRLPRARLTSDFQCVTGWRVPAVHWAGVRLADVLRLAGVRPGATAVQFFSFDGVYTESLTLEQANRRDVLVADTLTGAPLTREHGGPARLLVAPMYGYKSCKWLSRIEVSRRLVPGYWERFGYAQDAWVGRSNGRSDAPTA
jgi:DMSO/TMAO reductase YedYZ molybdopterin-dependent catalytic subunit